MNQDRFRKLLEGLLEKSRKNQVEWEPGVSNSCIVRFPDGSHIEVAGESPSHEPDWASAELCSPEGSTIRHIHAEELGEQGENYEFEFLNTVLQDANRVAHGHDKVFDAVEEYLKK